MSVCTLSQLPSLKAIEMTYFHIHVCSLLLQTILFELLQRKALYTIYYYYYCLLYYSALPNAQYKERVQKITEVKYSLDKCYIMFCYIILKVTYIGKVIQTITKRNNQT